MPANSAPPAARSAWIGTRSAIAVKLRQVALEVRWRTAGHLMALSATAMAGLFFLLLPLWRDDAREFLWCGAFLLVITLLRPQSVAPWVLEGYPLLLVLAWLFGFLVPYQFFWEKLFSLLLGVQLTAWGRRCHQGVMLLSAALCVLSPFLTTSIAPFFTLHVLLILVVLILVYGDLARQSPRVDETPWMHLAVTLLHGGNVVYFFLFGFVPVGPDVQNVVLIVRGGER